MHFREPLISVKPIFLELAHVWVYSYSIGTILSAYNASVMFLWHSYQSTMSGYNVISF